MSKMKFAVGMMIVVGLAGNAEAAVKSAASETSGTVGAEPASAAKIPPVESVTPETDPSSGSTAIVSTATLTAETSANQKPWSVRAQADYYLKHRRDHDAYTGLTLDLIYKFNKKNSVRVLQTATKLQVVNRQEQEFLLNDTSLQYSRNLIEDWHEISLGVRPAVTLPTSLDSGKQGIVSRPSVTVLVDRKFLGGRLSARYAPYYAYQINRYYTRIGGAPLQQHSLGHTLQAGFDVTKKISLGVAAVGAYNWDQQSPYSTINPRPKGTYLYDASVGYAVNKNIELAVGYSQGDAFMKEGRYDVNFYDPANTRYYFTLGASM